MLLYRGSKKLITYHVLYKLFDEYKTNSTSVYAMFSIEFRDWIYNKYGIWVVLTNTYSVVKWLDQQMLVANQNKKLLFDLKYLQ